MKSHERRTVSNFVRIALWIGAVAVLVPLAMCSRQSSNKGPVAGADSSGHVPADSVVNVHYNPGQDCYVFTPARAFIHPGEWIVWHGEPTIKDSVVIVLPDTLFGAQKQYVLYPNGVTRSDVATASSHSCNYMAPKTCGPREIGPGVDIGHDIGK